MLRKQKNSGNKGHVGRISSREQKRATLRRTGQRGIKMVLKHDKPWNKVKS